MILRTAMAGLRLFDPEVAHRMTIAGLRLLPQASAIACDDRLAITLAGLTFPNPVGLAAGFDKDAQAAHAMPRFGFGSVEVGTLTPLPQAGNPRPRLFRLVEDAAVINRMGFNNAGQDDAAPRLAQLRKRGHAALVGVNIGANKDAADRIADYVRGVQAMAGLADWLTVNISSPNTPGLRALQDEGALDALLAAVAAARLPGGPPVFLKVAPDLSLPQVDGIVRSAMDHRIDALIVGNTTISRPGLASRWSGEAGGLSGAPLAPLALARLIDFRKASGGAMPLIAAGGIGSAQDVWERMRAGASIVQLYSALVFAGPWLARDIVRDLADMLARSDHGRLSDIIGEAAA